VISTHRDELRCRLADRRRVGDEAADNHRREGCRPSGDVLKLWHKSGRLALLIAVAGRCSNMSYGCEHGGVVLPLNVSFLVFLAAARGERDFWACRSREIDHEDWRQMVCCGEPARPGGLGTGAGAN
jgi:hypothetical protein